MTETRVAAAAAARRRSLLRAAWTLCTAGVALLLTVGGLVALGRMELAAAGQLARLHDGARQGMRLAVERQAARLLQPVLIVQAARVADDLQRLTRGENPAALFGPVPAAAGETFTLQLPGGVRHLAVAAVAERWLRVEGLGAARGFVVRGDGVVLTVAPPLTTAAGAAAPLTAGQPLPAATAEQVALTQSLRAGERGMRTLSDAAGAEWVVAYEPLHEYGGSIGLLLRSADLAPEYEAARQRLASNAAAGAELNRHTARRWRILLFALLAVAWFLALLGGRVFVRLLDRRDAA